MVRERCERSLFWRVVHWLGSLQLALILLAMIAIACAVATFAESGFSAKVAQAYIYKAPWFILWLGVLCVNLFAVTLTRWPWEKKHTGFIVTHYGIIILLAGAVVGLQTGFEGNVTLVKDAAPTKRITTNRSIIQLESPADSYLYLKSFDADLARPSAKKPRIFPVPGTDLRIVADDYAPSLKNLPRIVPSTTPGSPPGILLRLSSTARRRTIDIPLLPESGKPATDDFFGMAEIRFSEKLPAPPAPEPAEMRMVFANYAPVSDSVRRVPVDVRVSSDGQKLTILGSGGTGATYSLAEVAGKPVEEAGVVVTAEKYWPHFAIKDGRPQSLSDNPENPAVLVRIESAAAGKPALDLAPDGSGGVLFRLTRGSTTVADGKLEPGVPVNTGWADWQAALVSFEPAAALVREIQPAPADPGEPATPGFRARLEGTGTRGPERWVESGSVTSLTDGRQVVRIGYGLETKPLPFSMRLLKFEVPRDEGTDSPADFIATVEFQDAKTGATKTGQARMNRPASFPGTLAANFTGINYKFSQAEWNPRNLDETTLQVLYDPGWLLKWVGSLGICVGIFIQFYWKPRAKTPPGTPSESPSGRVAPSGIAP